MTRGKHSSTSKEFKNFCSQRIFNILTVGFFLSYNGSQVIFHSALEENISVAGIICNLGRFGSRFQVPLEETANIC